jgi:DNA-directed RNA polymerase specialized sigma24 family protein
MTMAQRAEGVRRKLEPAVVGADERPALLAELRVAVARALRELPAPRRAALQHHVVDGLSAEQIGRLYGLAPATVELWLGHTHRRVLERVRRWFGDELRIAPLRVDQALGLGERELEARVLQCVRDIAEL